MARALVNRQQVETSRNPYSSTDIDGNIVAPFGAASPNKYVYPNDSILLDVYNYTNDFLETIYRPDAYGIDNFKVSIDIEKALRQQQYYSGKYNINARFLRNYLGSGDGFKIAIQEISIDRLEMRVVPYQPAGANDAQLENFNKAFGIDFFTIEKNSVLPNLYIYKNQFEAYKVFDYVQDPFTFNLYPYSIIIKFTAPLPLSVQVDDLVWLAQEVSAPLSDTVTIIPPKPVANYTYIGPPNYSVLSEKTTNAGTDYKSWDEVLTTNVDTSLSLIQKIFSGSLVEGVALNQDFRDFGNFIHFSSAEERLRNFKYKLELLEFYDERISALSQSYANTPAFTANSNLTGSEFYINNVLDAKTKKSALIGTFDSYENYLYYQSSSYETSSFGEFYPTTWPKVTSTRPYVNYSTTSSQAVEWFNGIIQSASIYDLNNYKNLRQLIPEHVYSNPVNDQYVLFVDMIGHFYDLIYQYIKQMTSVHERYESITEGFAKDLVYAIGENLGLNTENGHQLDELWEYVLGVNENGSYISPTYTSSTEDKTREIWKRIITNLPYLLKTKGTARGIRALINCYGIPSTILRVKEYGGPEPEFSTSSQLEYDQFYYGLLVGSGSSQITIPVANYSDSNGSTGGYSALELRFRLDTSILTSSLTYDILSGPIAIRVNPGAGTMTVGSQTFSASIAETDTDWWYVLVNGGSKAYVGANRYGKAVIYSSSASPGSITSPSTALIPGSSGGTKFYGLVNEFRLWKSALDLDVFENHILSATSFQGPLSSTDIVGSTSSFNELKVRFTLGADSKKYNLATTTSITSSHPDQTSLRYTSTAVRGASFSGYTSDSASYWIPQTETQFLEYVDGGANRNIGNKIRIEEVIVADEQLLKDGTIQDSVQDLYPVDSPRVVVAFSPNDELNEDISEQYGGLSLDNFIGDPADYYRDEFSRLEILRHNYFKKYQKRNDAQGFIRLTQNYDASLFQLIKQFVPERAALQTGVVVESHLLHRNKIKQIKPSYSDNTYTSSLQITRDQQGFVQDMDGDQRVPGGYIFDTEIARSYLTGGDTSILEGSTQREINLEPYELSESTILDQPSLQIYTTPYVYLNEFNDSSITSLEDVAAELPFESPSKYQYNTWYKTGSADTDWRLAPSIGEDYSNPIQPIYTLNRLSNIYETADDRFGGLFNTNRLRRIYYNSPTHPLLRTYGFPTNAQIITIGTNRYGVKATQTGGNSAAFNYDLANCFTQPSQSIYRIRGRLSISNASNFLGLTIYQRNSTSFVTLASNLGAEGASEVGFDIRVTVVPDYPTLRFGTAYDSSTTGRTLTLQYLKVELISKAEIQDSDMRWIGRKKSYYEGSKLTGAGININSPDTIDGGPVITVNTVNPKIASSGPRPILPSQY